MADFGVTAVRYDTERKHIQYVKLTRNLIGKVSPIHIVGRSFVADLIKMNKVTFETLVKDAQGKSVRGADIHVLEDVYLSTDKNSSKRDNLGNLPEF